MSPILSVGALFPAVRRGITADGLAAAALGRDVYTVCTAFVIAGRGRVTDFVEVPEDTVRAQIEHVLEAPPAAAMKIGVLAAHGTAAAVLEAAADFDGPVVMDLQLSGPDRETLLSGRGIQVVREQLGVPDAVLLSRKDAELLSEGEIASLDDAQVAAQRIVRRGARSVLIKCGNLAARHFEIQENGGGIPEGEFASDIFYDGTDFALFEAPLVDEPIDGGPASGHAVALADALARGLPMVDAMQKAKRFVSEALKPDVERAGIDYFWGLR